MNSHWHADPSVSQAEEDYHQIRSLPQWYQPNPPGLRENEWLQHYKNTNHTLKQIFALFVLTLKFLNHLCGTAVSPGYSHSPEALSQLQQSCIDPRCIKKTRVTQCHI